MNLTKNPNPGWGELENEGYANKIVDIETMTKNPNLGFSFLEEGERGEGRAGQGKGRCW